MRYIVLGAGRQGLAIAYDLAEFGGADVVTVVDSDPKAVRDGVRRLRKLAKGTEFRAVKRALDLKGSPKLLRGNAVAVSALPYRFNPGWARAAVSAGVSFCDLGGNTALVKEALKLNAAARKARVTIVPDCGLAPGLSNVLAAIAVAEVPNARHVQVRCGGLPVEPKGPLGYSLLFSIEGLTNEYMGQAVVLRNGKITRIEAFTECEPFRGPAKLGKLEAFVTSGGTSVAPWTFRGKLKTYEYKTVRYRGHFDKVRAMIDLGLLDEGDPRDMFHRVAGPRLAEPGVKDLAILRVECTDSRGRGVRYSMLHEYDAKTGFTAMEQTTGYPAAVVARDMAHGKLRPGAYTPERAGFDAGHVRDLRARGLAIRRTKIR
ncbi:MAG: saccharopine dehydrogenase family protein [Planctomycetota bacterium]|jgi:lysine 6-dehydrogenase